MSDDIAVRGSRHHHTFTSNAMENGRHTQTLPPLRSATENDHCHIVLPPPELGTQEWIRRGGYTFGLEPTAVGDGPVKPRLLHYSSSYFPRIGGLPVTIRDIAYHTSDVFEHHLMTRDLWRAGVSWERAPVGADRSDPHLTVHRFRSNGEYLTGSMIAFLKRGDHDALIIHSTHPSLLGATEHTDAKVIFMPQTKTRQPVARFTDKIDHTIVLLESDKQHFVGHGIPADKITVLPKPVDMQVFKPSPMSHQNRKRRHLLYAGRIAPEKRVWLLPAVLRKLRDRDKRYTLDIVGDYDHPERDGPPLMEAIAANQVKGSVHFSVAHTAEEMAAAYQACDVLVSASINETFGHVFSEALACGLAVVTTARGGVREWAGGYVDFVDSIEEIVEAIERAQSPLVSGSVRERFEREYSWQARKAEFVDVVRGVLG